MFKALNITVIISSIFFALLTYFIGYNSMLEDDPISRGFAEFFVLISSIILLMNGISLSKMISKSKKWITATILTLYTLLAILPMSIQNIRMLSPLLILSIGVVLIGVILTRKTELKHIDNQNLIILIITIFWSVLMVRTM